MLQIARNIPSLRVKAIAIVGVAGTLIAVSGVRSLARDPVPNDKICWPVLAESCADRAADCQHRDPAADCHYCDGTTSLTAICIHDPGENCTSYSWTDCGPRRKGFCSNEHVCIDGILDGGTCYVMNCTVAP